MKAHSKEWAFFFFRFQEPYWFQAALVNSAHSRGWAFCRFGQSSSVAHRQPRAASRAPQSAAASRQPAVSRLGTRPPPVGSCQSSVVSFANSYAVQSPQPAGRRQPGRQSRASRESRVASRRWPVACFGWLGLYPAARDSVETGSAGVFRAGVACRVFGRQATGDRSQKTAGIRSSGSRPSQGGYLVMLANRSTTVTSKAQILVKAPSGRGRRHLDGGGSAPSGPANGRPAHDARCTTSTSERTSPGAMDPLARLTGAVSIGAVSIGNRVRRRKTPHAT